MKNMRRELFLVVGFFAFTGSGLVKQSHRSNDREQATDLLKVLDLPIWNLDWYGPTWLVNISIGSPGQPIAAMIDPYAADTGTVLMNTIGGLPNFSPNLSSTFQTDTSLVFNASWGSGTYAQDIYNLGGVSLANVRFIELSADSEWHTDCYLGLGFPDTENSYTPDGQWTIYPTILGNLVNQGTLLTSSYSIWMDDQSGRTGHLLLGGIDTTKYVSPLISALNRGPAARLNTVKITDRTGGTSSISIEAEQSVIFDIGFFTTLSGQTVTKIWDALGAQYDHEVDPTEAIPIVPCSYKNNESMVAFSFSGDLPDKSTTISVDVPLGEFIIQNGSGPHYDQGPYAPACTLTIISSSSSPLSTAIGTNVMKYLYTVFDTTSLQLSLATRNFNSTSASVYAIPDGGVQCLSQVGGQACSSSGSSGNGGGTVSNPSTSGSGGGGFLGLPGGLGVGFGALFALICIKVVLICWWKSRKRS